MADRRKGKIKTVWSNSVGGKITIIVAAGIILSLVGSVIAVPVRYETKADAGIKQKDCQDAIIRSEERLCERIGKAEDETEKNENRYIEILGSLKRIEGKIEK